MPLLDFNFEDVPDEIKPIPKGDYNLETPEAPTIEPTSSGKGNNLIVQFAIADGEYKGRKLKDYFYLGNEIGLINTKRFLKACGVTPTSSGINTEELMGRLVKARVGSRTYTDNESGEEREVANIDSYLLA